MPLILSGNVGSAAAAGYEVANSCRFNRPDSPRLVIANPTEGVREKGTFSTWFKKASGGTAQYLFSTWNNATNGYSSGVIYFPSADDRLNVSNYVASGASGHSTVITERRFNDPGAWYHVVVAWDTTDGTAADRYKIYVNGTRETVFNGTPAYPTADQELFFQIGGTANPQHIGYQSTGSDTHYFDGYLAETVHIDGYALAADSFGEFDDDSPTIWKPKDVSGLTFGDEGFYLDYEDSGDLGDDESGNGNDFAETNLAAADQMTDTPTNNFCTCNPLLNTGGGITFQEGNCKIKSAADNQWTIGTQHSQQGYFEVKVGTAPNASNGTGLRIGIVSLDDHIDPDGTGATFSSSSDTYHFDNPTAQGFRKFDSGTTTNIGGTRAINDILSVAWSSVAPNGIWFAVNGVWFNDQEDGPDSSTLDTSNPDFSINTGKFYLPVFMSSLTGLDEADINFGNPSNTISSSNTDANGYGNFEYAVPSGFFALNTKNLAEYG